MSKHYDTKLINKILKNFKKENFHFKELNIYIDMDNTILLFSPNGDLDALKQMKRKGYFETLPILNNSVEAIKILNNISNVYILSACGTRRGTNNGVKREKRKWLKKNMPFIRDEQIILSNVGEDKSKYIKDSLSKSNILIDDYHKNISDWFEKGLVAIKKTRSNKKRPVPQIHDWFEIFEILKEIGVQR